MGRNLVSTIRTEFRNNNIDLAQHTSYVIWGGFYGALASLGMMACGSSAIQNLADGKPGRALLMTGLGSLGGLAIHFFGTKIQEGYRGLRTESEAIKTQNDAYSPAWLY